MELNPINWIVNFILRKERKALIKELDKSIEMYSRRANDGEN